MPDPIELAPIPPARMPTWAVVLLGLYYLAAVLVILYLLILVWPGKPATEIPRASNAPASSQEKALPEPHKGKEQRFIEWLAEEGDDVRLLIMVALAGALGAYVHASQSFVTFVGNRQIVSSWL